MCLFDNPGSGDSADCFSLTKKMQKNSQKKKSVLEIIKTILFLIATWLYIQKNESKVQVYDKNIFICVHPKSQSKF